MLMLFFCLITQAQDFGQGTFQLPSSDHWNQPTHNIVIQPDAPSGINYLNQGVRKCTTQVILGQYHTVCR